MSLPTAGDGATTEYPVTTDYPVTTEFRTRVVAVAGFSTIVLVALAYLVPVSYAVLKPGPVLNTLGSAGGKPLIAISGHTTYPTSGRLDLTTVRIAGGPDSAVSLPAVLYSWLDRKEAVVPEEEYFAPGQSQQESDAENKAEMVSSQESATAAALAALNIPVPTTLTVHSLVDKAPSAAVLRAGDVVLSVDGHAAADLSTLRRTLSAVRPGDRITVKIRRSGTVREVGTRTLAGSSGQAAIGVYLDPTFRFPFQVKIQIENIGGPSAGMMFALGIIDRLTPGDLTGGKRIAGTGAIDADGTVGPIGGIRQKMAGARAAGAVYFLAPQDDCDEVTGHVPAGLRVFRVGTLTEARATVEAIAAGRTSGLPGC